MKRIIISNTLNDMLADKFTPADELVSAFQRYFDVDEDEALKLLDRADNKLIAKVMNEYRNISRK